jgi:hypothetical protein
MVGLASFLTVRHFQSGTRVSSIGQSPLPELLVQRYYKPQSPARRSVSTYRRRETVAATVPYVPKFA